jgi:hypothetical protein
MTTVNNATFPGPNGGSDYIAGTIIDNDPVNDDFDDIKYDLDYHVSVLQAIYDKLDTIDTDADVNLTADATISLINTTGTGQINAARLDISPTISSAITTAIETHRTTTTDASMHTQSSIQSTKLAYSNTPTSLITSPVNLLDELKNTRVMIDRIIGSTYWTDTPSKTIAQLASYFNASGYAYPQTHGSQHVTGGTDVIPNAVAGGNAGLMTGAQVTKLNGIEEYATADQSAAEIRTLVDSATDSNVFTDAYKTKVDGIETNATADQTATEIRQLVADATDSNVFTDGYKTKLDNFNTVDGYLAVPATSTTNNGKILVAGATAGSAAWQSISTQVYPISTKTGNYTLTTSDYTILCDATSNDITIRLPDASTNVGKIYHIKRMDASSTYDVIIDAYSTQTIDGELTLDISVQYEAITIQAISTGWVII